ncbi:hypothetical protein HU200_056707 [Digitaria exilis]|uniref:FAM192A/Fyv6 N-terminal domain-containing protein n=1 Tax=Digitaria exilis TaxID=1010633 RepID=A0A835AQU6_9POAL|nr:hypothetical protein HU200_056707 [Digitaria exilis]
MAGQEPTPNSKAAAPPATIRLVNFISEDQARPRPLPKPAEICVDNAEILVAVEKPQLNEVKRTRGERVEDGTAQRDKPLFQVRPPLMSLKPVRPTRCFEANAASRVSPVQILQENKEKKDAEFNERFKHRPPKALDEDETEFLEKLASSRREYEQQVANEEAEQLRSFHEAVAARSNIVHELETPTVSRPEENRPKPPTKRSQPAVLKNVIISVKPQAKKAKLDAEAKPTPEEQVSLNGHDADQKPPTDATKAMLGSLVAYDDDDDDESGDNQD